MCTSWRAIPLLLSVLFLTSSASAQSERAVPLRLTAAKTYGAVSIDGRLDEPAWSTAEGADEFLQFEPDEGAAATHATDVRVLYGPRSIYIGARMHDDEPGLVQQTLGRRDEYMQADWFAVSIDSHLDRRTAHLFAVNAGGVQYDALQTEGQRTGPRPGGGGDASWDAIWSSAARVTPEGWVAEIEIPYSMLRFSQAARQTWGVHFSREIPRLGETSEWPLVPRTERANFIAEFGVLQGISGIAPRRNVQITPYTLSRLDRVEDPTEPGTARYDAGVDAGADVRLGLGSNVTLNATVNPDFGQVESDPAVLNLTAFETFFQERRPFFVEGSQTYQFTLVGPSNSLLYTRRIGANNPVLGAAKLSGRTAHGLSFGVLGATTGESLRGGDLRQYGAARATQQIGEFSSAGGILTLFDGPDATGRRQAMAAGADWDLRSRDNTYGLQGFAAFTAGSNLDPGFTGQLLGARRQGAWTYEAGADFADDRFDPNDVGRLPSNDTWGIIARFQHDIKAGRAFGPFQRAQVGGFTFQQWSVDEGVNVGGTASLSSSWTLRGFQTVRLGGHVGNPYGAYDLYETRGLWANRIPTTYAGQVSYETDERRRWQFEPNVQIELDDDGGRVLSGGVQGDWNVLPQLSLAARTDIEVGMGTIDWAANETFRRDASGWSVHDAEPLKGGGRFVAFDDGGRLDAILAGVEPLDGAPADPPRYLVPVFAARDTRTIDVTVRASYTFTPDLALQFYSQLFVARAKFADYRILSDPDTYAAFDAFPKRFEFSRGSFQFNAVLRWEYRPGSELYVVWTQRRRADDVLDPLAPLGRSPFDRPLGDQVSDTFGIFPGNVFLVKLNYTFLR